MRPPRAKWSHLPVIEVGIMLRVISDIAIITREIPKHKGPRWIIISEKLPCILYDNFWNRAHIIHNHSVTMKTVELGCFEEFFHLFQREILSEVFTRKIITINYEFFSINRRIIFNRPNVILRKMLPTTLVMSIVFSSAASSTNRTRR